MRLTIRRPFCAWRAGCWRRCAAGSLRIGVSFGGPVDARARAGAAVASRARLGGGAAGRECWRASSACLPRSTTTPTSPRWASGASARARARQPALRHGQHRGRRRLGAGRAHLGRRRRHGRRDRPHWSCRPAACRASCGKRGCVEAEACGPAIARKAVARLEADAARRPDPARDQPVAGLEAVTAELGRAGRGRAIRWRSTCSWMLRPRSVRASALAINLLNPRAYRAGRRRDQGRRAWWRPCGRPPAAVGLLPSPGSISSRPAWATTRRCGARPRWQKR